MTGHNKKNKLGLTSHLRTKIRHLHQLRLGQRNTPLQTVPQFEEARCVVRGVANQLWNQRPLFPQLVHTLASGSFHGKHVMYFSFYFFFMQNTAPSHATGPCPSQDTVRFIGFVHNFSHTPPSPPGRKTSFFASIRSDVAVLNIFFSWQQRFILLGEVKNLVFRLFFKKKRFSKKRFWTHNFLIWGRHKLKIRGKWSHDSSQWPMCHFFSPWKVETWSIFASWRKIDTFLAGFSNFRQISSEKTYLQNVFFGYF